MKTPRVGLDDRRHTPAFEIGPGDSRRLDRKLAGAPRTDHPAFRRVADDFTPRENRVRAAW